MSLCWIDEDKLEFPPLSEALLEPNGLLAVGGDLSVDRLLKAYSSGIFPWYSEEQPILWWSPDPRMVLRPDTLKISRSLRKQLRRSNWRLSLDEDFSQVIFCCAGQRDDHTGTWITEEMQEAYCDLHEAGFAHSVEVWDEQDGSLLGGLYGVAIGGVFFGGSMFSKADNASKIALVYLMQQLRRWGFKLVDCQVSSDHLVSLGAFEISRSNFGEEIEALAVLENFKGPWSFDDDLKFEFMSELLIEPSIKPSIKPSTEPSAELLAKAQPLEKDSQ